jgi:hypothetical protein
MAIPSQEIGYGTEEKLLWQISKQIQNLIGVTYNSGSGFSTTYVPYTGATSNVNLGSYNISANSFINGFSSITASGTQVVLTVNSAPEILVSGSGGQTIKLPDATTLANGTTLSFNNNQSSGAISVNNNSNTLVLSVPSGGYAEIMLLSNSTAAGSWDKHFQAPSNVSWSTNTFDYPGSITSATWNGTVIAPNRGGTGQSTYTDGQLLIGNTTGNTLSKSTLTPGTGISIVNGNGSITITATGAVSGAVTGSGTTNYVPKFTSSTVVGNSNIQDLTTGVLVSNSITASSAIARGTNLTSTLVASANGDVLVGLDIAPTFTNGSFTSVQNIGLRLINLLNAPAPDATRPSPQLLFSGSQWNSFLGTTRMTAAMQVDSYQQNSNPTISKLSFLVGTDNAIPVERMNINSDGLLSTTGGANFTAGTGSYFNDVTLNQTSTATASVSVSSNRLVLKGTAWNSIVGSRPNMGYLQVINIGNNFNPTIDKLSFFVGSASSSNTGNVVGNATERLALRTDGVFSFFNSSTTETLRLFNTGNLTLQNGGTFTDAGYRLDVTGTTRLNGLSTFQGTSASDSAPLGSEIATTGSGTNWTGTSFATGYTHTTGDTTALTTSLAAVSGTYYQITYTITGRTAGSITIAYGGTSTAGITATGATGPLASSTAVLTITPTTDFDGTVVLSIKSIGTSSASSTFANSSGTGIVEIRASSSSNNMFIGTSAGRRNTTGTDNTFLGFNAGLSNTTGGFNVAIGTLSFLSNTTGSSNIAIGAGALSSNTTSIDNIAIGGNALGANTTGNANTSVGRNALQFITLGSNNVALGFQVGRYFGGSTANNLTSADNSIFIGNQVYALANSQTNQIVIGYQTIGLGSNTTVLGNSSTTLTALYGAVITGGTSINASAQLQIDSTTKGVLFPRMTTTQKNAISSPATGLVVFDTTLGKLCVFSTTWQTITSS